MKTEQNIFLLLLLLVIAIPAEAAELPMIEMPKYIIEGVEQATSLFGNKIPPEAHSSPILPETASHERPALPLDILATPIERPGLLILSGSGRTVVEAASGGFGKAHGFFSTIGENDLSGYSLSGDIERFPRRTSFGPKLSTSFKGSGIRWFGTETTVAPSIEFISNSFARKKPTGTDNYSLTGFGLGASITPTALFDGRFSGSFQYDYTGLDNIRNLTASHDKLTLDYFRHVYQGWLTSKFIMEVEAVSIDKSGHSLFSFESIYFHRHNESILWRAGLLGYTGKTIRVPVATAEGISEGRKGAAILAGLSWQPAPGSVVDFDFIPRPRFETFKTIFGENMELDSTVRGTTVELPMAINIAYWRTITYSSSIRLSFQHSAERHRPFRLETNDLNWRINTRRAEITTGRFELNLEPIPQLGVTLYSEATSASSYGDSAGTNAPFIPPVIIGGDFILQLGNLMLDNAIVWKDGSFVNFDGNSKSPVYLTWNTTLHWRVKPGLTGKIGIDNLLNQRRWDTPGYMLPPLTIWAGIGWQGNSAVW